MPRLAKRNTRKRPVRIRLKPGQAFPRLAKRISRQRRAGCLPRLKRSRTHVGRPINRHFMAGTTPAGSDPGVPPIAALARWPVSLAIGRSE